MSQAEAIRDALTKLGVEAETAKIKEHIKEHHRGVSVTAPGFPSALSSIRRELREKGGGEGEAAATPSASSSARIQRPKKKKKGRTPAERVEVGTVTEGGQLFVQLQKLKGLVGRDTAKDVVGRMIDRT